MLFISRQRAVHPIQRRHCLCRLHCPFYSVSSWLAGRALLNRYFPQPSTNSEQHQEAGFLHLVSFRKLELVEQDGVSGRYRLGPFALRLGLACFRG